ncbi:TonB-dependent receptor [Bacteroides stercorirosoris]|uniref:Carboxypeptidase-like regulatory domain-containing protein n=1 Tax=Bacteroides stercorirosoris TaxID=871324 RepID=A0A413H8W6_9BACE|nr:carboxypeptidase-like regulatory domain-containing protein [Bacteroides stercorirosoris]RGX80098.1 carboxypeptidase-like regulatory domain-containing protein [Bacteroides stercorirosoris]
MDKIKVIAIIALFFSVCCFAQERPVQTLRGVVNDRASGHPIPYATVRLTDMPDLGAVCDSLGRFTLPKVPVGRHSVESSFMGYEPAIIREILVTSAKEVYLEIAMRENVNELNEVVVRANNRDETMNKMAVAGARMLSVEEASRYAGGFDDPARLVASFAGVAPSVSNNGISIHGNAPHLLQWRLEDVEIPNPNHFADIATLGGGILSSLSAQVLGNSDFFTGAFPAEYGNAVSGVFDMKLRNGNNQKNENTFQVGIMGIDFASEGPLSKKHKASYIFNYRYSTTGLLNVDLGGKMDYQDLNFKLNFPTRSAGTFSVWGTALIDKFKSSFDRDPGKWDYLEDAAQAHSTQYMAAGGITHRYFFDENTLLKTTLAGTYSDQEAFQINFDRELNSSPFLDQYSRSTNLILTSSLNRKISNRFTNKTGFTYTQMFYNMDLKLAPFIDKPLELISKGDGNTSLLSAYNSSSWGMSDQLSLNFGLYGQLLTLNNRWTLEPRAGLKYQANAKTSFALAYGMYSRMEKIDVYFVKTQSTGDESVNKNLDFTKAHHLMLSFAYKMSNNMSLKVEPYVQFLYDVPVMRDSSFSVLNRDEFFVENTLVNKGRGRNIGVDITWERALSKGLYYMVTASLFDSRYRGGDGVWHNTRFNRKYVLNGLIGKEWMLGRNKQNILSVNLKMTLQGGERYAPIDVEATMAHPDKEVQYDETRAYSIQRSPMLIGNYTVSYRINKRRVSHEFAIKGINFTGAKEYIQHLYNIKTEKIEASEQKTGLTNISYKIEF